MASVSSEIQFLINTYFPPHTHPYRLLEQRIDALIKETDTVLEIGCGRTAPILRTLKGRARTLIGIEVVEFTIGDPDLQLFNCDVSDMGEIADNSIDLAFSRSVMEHVRDPDRAFREIARVLAPGGTYVFLTPNYYDYFSLIASVVPNRFHGTLVKKTEGRDESDTFPTFYKTNTRRRIAKIIEDTSLEIRDFAYLAQYPSYFVFNRTLFHAGCWFEKLLERYRPLNFLLAWILCSVAKPSDPGLGPRHPFAADAAHRPNLPASR